MKLITVENRTPHDVGFLRRRGAAEDDFPPSTERSARVSDHHNQVGRLGLWCVPAPRGAPHPGG